MRSDILSQQKAVTCWARWKGLYTNFRSSCIKPLCLHSRNMADRSLFTVDARAFDIIPDSMGVAAKIATMILRSEIHTQIFCELYKGDGHRDHVNKAELKQRLSANGLFKIDQLRSMPLLNTPACAMCNFDPFRIYFNPLMLLEMKNREFDEKELQATIMADWPDLLIPATSPWLQVSVETKSTTHPPSASAYNALAFAYQMRNKLQQEHEQARDRKAVTAFELREEKQAHQAALAVAGQSCRRQCQLPEPPAKKVRSEDPPEVVTPSKLTVYQKNVTMLTVLLVHVCDHLLYFLLSTVQNERGSAPHKKYAMSDTGKFTDIGQLMERSLYGWSIQHGYDPLVAHPIAIDEIIGMKEQERVAKFIVEPCSAFLEMVDNPDAKLGKGKELTLSDLKFEQTSGVAYEQVVSKTVVLGGVSEGVSTPMATSPTSGAAMQGYATSTQEDVYNWMSNVPFFQGRE